MFARTLSSFVSYGIGLSSIHGLVYEWLNYQWACPMTTSWQLKKERPWFGLEPPFLENEGNPAGSHYRDEPADIEGGV